MKLMQKTFFKEGRLNVVAKPAIMAVCVLAALGADAIQYWRGTAENPVWDTTTANWAANATATTYARYQNDNTSSQPYFDAGGSRDITVASGGLLAYVINIKGGSHTLSGGAIAAIVMDPWDGDLTIYNTVELATSGGSYGFRPRAGVSTISVGDGGSLVAQINPWSNSTLDAKLVVLTNGTLSANFYRTAIKNNKFTLYFNGGTLSSPEESECTFGNSKFVLGAGGIHIQEHPDVAANSFIPGPIGTDETLPSDGGVWIEEHVKYMLLPDGISSYRGGLHINSSTSALAVRSERNFGAEPEAPTNNIFFLKNNATLVAHSSNPGNILVHPNRNLYIAEGVNARLRTYSSNNFSMTIQGTVEFANTNNGALVIYDSASGYSDSGVIALCPSGNRTNHLGRLLVKAPAVIGSGTTLLENTIRPEGGINDINENAPLNISDNGHLMVTGGVLRLVSSSRHVCQSSRLTVSGGVADFSAASGAYEFLHGCDGVATTTIRNGGKLAASTIRMSGNVAAYASDATKSVINVEEGGALRVTKKIYLPGDGKKGTLNFNGGMLEWAHAETGQYLEGWGNEQGYTRNGLVINVMEGGMNITNHNHFYTGVPIRSGAEHDGGLTKWGAGTFAMMGTNTFNGPLAIMQGAYLLGGANLLNSNIAVRVNAGATFNMNTRSQGVARLEGSGTIRGENKGDENLYVSKAIAPGMGADSLGTLTVRDDVCRIADDVALEIDVDTEGNSDRLNYPVAIDLSKMTLKINDRTKLRQKNGNGQKNIYKIATLSGGIVNNTLFKSTNLPPGWEVRYFASSHELKVVPFKSMVVSFK